MTMKDHMIELIDLLKKNTNRGYSSCWLVAVGGHLTLNRDLDKTAVKNRIHKLSAKMLEEGFSPQEWDRLVCSVYYAAWRGILHTTFEERHTTLKGLYRETNQMFDRNGNTQIPRGAPDSAGDTPADQEGPEKLRDGPSDPGNGDPGE